MDKPFTLRWLKFEQQYFLQKQFGMIITLSIAQLVNSKDKNFFIFMFGVQAMDESQITYSIICSDSLNLSWSL
jgi:hypothetical protein